MPTALGKDARWANCAMPEGDDVCAMGNAIHHCGLGPWADGFVNDVKIVLRESLGARGVV